MNVAPARRPPGTGRAGIKAGEDVAAVHGQGQGAAGAGELSRVARACRRRTATPGTRGSWRTRASSRPRACCSARAAGRALELCHRGPGLRGKICAAGTGPGWGDQFPNPPHSPGGRAEGGCGLGTGPRARALESTQTVHTHTRGKRGPGTARCSAAPATAQGPRPRARGGGVRRGGGAGALPAGVDQPGRPPVAQHPHLWATARVPPWLPWRRSGRFWVLAPAFVCKEGEAVSVRSPPTRFTGALPTEARLAWGPTAHRGVAHGPPELPPGTPASPGLPAAHEVQSPQGGDEGSGHARAPPGGREAGSREWKAWPRTLRLRGTHQCPCSLRDIAGDRTPGRGFLPTRPQSPRLPQSRQQSEAPVRPEAPARGRGAARRSLLSMMFCPGSGVVGHGLVQVLQQLAHAGHGDAKGLHEQQQLLRPRSCRLQAAPLSGRRQPQGQPPAPAPPHVRLRPGVLVPKTNPAPHLPGLPSCWALFSHCKLPQPTPQSRPPRLPPSSSTPFSGAPIRHKSLKTRSAP